jgi:hypothetical protein
MQNYLSYYVIWIESLNTDAVKILLVLFSLVPNEAKETPYGTNYSRSVGKVTDRTARTCSHQRVGIIFSTTTTTAEPNIQF